MIRLDDWAERLRSETSLEVHGVYSEAAAQRESRRDGAFVLLLSDDAEPSEVIGLVRQFHEIVVGTLLRVRNVRDRRGGEGMAEIEAVREQVRTALLGWTPDGADGQVTFKRGWARPPLRDGEQWWMDAWSVPVLRTQGD